MILFLLSLPLESIETFWALLFAAVFYPVLFTSCCLPYFWIV